MNIKNGKTNHSLINKKYRVISILFMCLCLTLPCYVYSEGNESGNDSQGEQIDDNLQGVNENTDIVMEQISVAKENSQKAEESLRIAQDALNKADEYARDSERIAQDMEKQATLSGNPDARQRYLDYKTKAEEARTLVDSAQEIYDSYFNDYQKTQEILDGLENELPGDGNPPIDPEMERELLQDTIVADDEYRTLYADYEAQEKILNDIRRELSKASPAETHKLLNELQEQTIIYQQKLEKVNNSMNGVIEAYRTLGDYYKEFGYVGDPVFIGTGDYYVEYEDFIAEDYLDKFIVKRQLCSSDVCDSFGYGWTCSLDSRIVRCVYEDKTPQKQMVEMGIECCKSMEDTFWGISNHSTEIEIFVSYARRQRNLLEIELSDLNEMIKVRNALLEKNKYCMYGRYKSLDSVYGFESNLIFLDESGNEIYFQYDGDGKWTPFGELTKNKINIFNLNSQNQYSNSDDCSGGYELVYTDNSRMIYDQYGILCVKIDRNGNKTIFKSKSGLIDEIITKTGEKIFIERNSLGFIENISGEISGEVNYSYKEKKINCVINNVNIKTEYGYDGNRLKKIIKGDGTCTVIDWEYNYSKKKYVCSKVTLENGSFESFIYDFPNKKVTHKTNTGKNEYFILNDFGNPIYKKDMYGNEERLEINQYGLITKVHNSNGMIKEFDYDELYRPIKVYTENGGIISINYCAEQKGNQIESIIDSDGVKIRYEYDSKGNILTEWINNTLITSIDYYPNGLIKKISEEEQSISYEYNNYGSITHQELRQNKGRLNEWIIDYDSNNRIIKMTDENGETTLFSYGNRSQIEKNNRIKTIVLFDERNRIYKKEIYDLINNSKKNKEYVYENGNIIQIKIDDLVYEEFDFSNDNEIEAYRKYNFGGKVAREGVQERFVFDGDYICEYIKEPIKDTNEERYSLENKKYNRVFKYSTISGNTVMKYIDEMGLESTATYNMYGNIIQETFPNGYNVKTLYSKAGRIIQKVDSEYKVWDYVYKNDGSYKIILSTPKGIICESEYDRKGRLVSYSDIANGNSYYEYDGEFCILERTDAYVIKREYDSYGRKTLESCETLRDRTFVEDYKIIYDDVNNKVQVFAGKNDSCFYECSVDGFGRIIRVLDRNGERNFKYDSLDRVILETDAKNQKVKYEYDANNQVNYILFDDQSERFINHDVNGNITCVSENGRIVRKTDYDVENKKISFVDMFGTVFDYYYGKDGVISKEVISKSGELDYSNLRNQNISEIDFQSLNLYGKVERNVLGKVVKHENEKSKFVYEYDLLKNITSIEDCITDSKVWYKYDSFGRCILLRTDDFEVKFEYDVCGNIYRILNAQNEELVLFGYDSKDREKYRKYWNGITENISYNEVNLIESKITKDQSGQILDADFLIYDEKNRISYKLDANGSITHYTYKPNGQVHMIAYPFTEELFSYHLMEAYDCGYPLKEETSGSLLYLDFSAKSELQKLLVKNNMNNLIKIPENEYVWLEEFEYTNYGAISSIKNPIGKVLFNYDENNHLIEKYYDGFTDKKMTFSWNDKGNLTNLCGVLSKMEFLYTESNRIAQIDYVDYLNETRELITYEYDALNRRIREYNDANSFSYMYDGFSTKVFEKYPIFENRIKSFSNATNDKRRDTESYRFIDDREYASYDRQRTVVNDDFSVKSGKNISDTTTYDSYSQQVRDVNINVRNETIINCTEDNLLQFNIKDFQKRLSLIMEKNDSNSVNMDSYLVNSSNGYNLLNQIRNIGYRDYLPCIKSFTSEDPTHDGVNWYSYCSGDSVNYVDSDGYVIMTIPQTYLMTDASYQNVKLGNSSTETIDKCGCYITSHANIMYELDRQGIIPEDKRKYASVIGINNNKDFFGVGEKDSGSLYSGKVNKELFSFTNNEYTVSSERYTKSDTFGTLEMEMQLAKMYGSKDQYAVEGVFNLSQRFPESGTNHMVILNDFSDVNGVFDSITNSSKNDKYRQNEDASAYNISNLKEIKVVKIEKNCG